VHHDRLAVHGGDRPDLWLTVADRVIGDVAELDLIERCRAGDSSAYGELHRRHVDAARALAWRMSRSAGDADDLVSEGFARVLAALTKGAGPKQAFRPYLLSTIRRLAYDRTNRERRESPSIAEFDVVAEVEDDPVIGALDRGTVAQAFATLPERWQMVLWYTEVEQQGPSDIAHLLGINAGAVAGLAYRAREGLRRAYLAQRPGGPDDDEACVLVRRRLATPSSERGRAKASLDVRAHLETCESCRQTARESSAFDSSMRAVLGVAILGPHLTGYLEALGSTARAHGAASASGSTPRLNPARENPAADAPNGEKGSRSLRRVTGHAARSGVAGHWALAPVVVASAIVTVAAVLAWRSPPIDGARTPHAPGASTTHRRITRPTPRRQRAPRATPPRAAAGSDRASGPSTFDRAIAVPVTRSSAGARQADHSSPKPEVAPRGDRPPARVPSPQPQPGAPDVRLTMHARGALVADRPGMIEVTLDGPDAATAGTARIDVDLGALEARRHPDAVGWTCVAAAQEVGCSADEAGPEGDVRSATIAIAVWVPAGVTGVDVRAAADLRSPRGAPGGAETAAHLPIAASGWGTSFATVDHAAVAAVGNGLVDCPPVSRVCVDARAGLGTVLDNQDFPMKAVDVDDDATTANSSAAQLTLPPGAEVLAADLVFGADLTAGANGDAAPRPAELASAVVVQPGGARHRVTARQVDQVGSRFQSVADVTELVRASADGWWTVGDVQLGTGVGRHGGWSLLVVYRDRSLPLRSVSLLGGLTQLADGTQASVPIQSYTAPPGPAAAAVTVVSYEGDRGVTGDQFWLAGQPLVDAANPAGNSCNGSIADGGWRDSPRMPGATNLFGFDVDRFALDAFSPGPQTFLDLATTSDTYLVGAIALSIDLEPT